jgi:hypothetical protein
MLKITKNFLKVSFLVSFINISARLTVTNVESAQPEPLTNQQKEILDEIAKNLRNDNSDKKMYFLPILCIKAVREKLSELDLKPHLTPPLPCPTNQMRENLSNMQ